jgi:hypothetical protein
MRIAIQPHHREHDGFHLPHQGTWFVILLVSLLLLLSKSVGSTLDDRRSTIDDQCVIAYNSTLIPMA